MPSHGMSCVAELDCDQNNLSSCMPKTCKVFYCRFGYARPGLLDFAWKIGWKWYIKWCSLPCLHASDHQKIPPALVYRAEQQDHLSLATHQHFFRKMGLAKKNLYAYPLL